MYQCHGAGAGRPPASQPSILSPSWAEIHTCVALRTYYIDSSTLHSNTLDSVFLRNLHSIILRIISPSRAKTCARSSQVICKSASWTFLSFRGETPKGKAKPWNFSARGFLLCEFLLQYVLDVINAGVHEFVRLRGALRGLDVPHEARLPHAVVVPDPRIVRPGDVPDLRPHIYIYIYIYMYVCVYALYIYIHVYALYIYI